MHALSFPTDDRRRSRSHASARQAGTQIAGQTGVLVVHNGWRTVEQRGLATTSKSTEGSCHYTRTRVAYCPITSRPILQLRDRRAPVLHCVRTATTTSTTMLLGFAALGGISLRRAKIAPLSSPLRVASRWNVCSGVRGAVGSAAESTVPVDGTEATGRAATANVIDILRERELLEACTGDLEGLREHCSKKVCVYAGFDPTADSLHLGNLLALISLRWFQRCGHDVIALLGGATGRIGDPSGKSAERPVLHENVLERNLAGIRRNLDAVLGADATVVNNDDWVGALSFVDFLRDVGRFARVNTMMNKDSVRTRLRSDEGISFTEFTYQLLQGYDFVHLADHHDVSVQLGGADQWGNITAGTELARKLRSRVVHGVTFPLLTTADGRKFGKSEGGAVWLAAEKLSPYQFYQHLFRVSDADVITFLKRLTFLPLAHIAKIEHEMRDVDYIANSAQRTLAEEVTRIVHGDRGVESALGATAAVAPGSAAKLSVEALEAISADMPCVTLQRDEVVGVGVVELMAVAGLQKSKGEARRLVNNGGAYVNNVKILNDKEMVRENDLVGAKLVLLAAGKKNKMLVRVQ